MQFFRCRLAGGGFQDEGCPITKMITEMITKMITKDDYKDYYKDDYMAHDRALHIIKYKNSPNLPFCLFVCWDCSFII